MATRQQIEEMSKEFYERGFNAHDVDYMEGRLSDDFIEHNPLPGLGNDKKGALETFRGIFAATPDLHGEIIETIVSGNRFALRSRFTGTDNGTGQMPGVPPTGKSFSAESIDVVTVNDAGEFAEHYGIQDVIGIMGQLGLLPPPPDPTTTA
jgi:predicted ester cyclase